MRYSLIEILLITWGFHIVGVIEKEGVVRFPRSLHQAITNLYPHGLAADGVAT